MEILIYGLTKHMSVNLIWLGCFFLLLSVVSIVFGINIFELLVFYLVDYGLF